MNTSPGRWARVLLWVVPALWSTNYLIARAADGVIGPHALAFGRWALAAALLLPLTAAGLWRKRAALRAEWRQLLVLGALGMWVCGAWMYHGGRQTSATNMALIYAVTPIAIAIVGARLLHERMLARQWVGAALALAGLLVMLPFTAVELLRQPAPAPAWQALALVVAAAVLPGVLSYGAYSYLQRELGAARTALMLYLTPVYAPLLAWGVLGEVPRWYHMAGALLILPSIALATRPSS